MKIAFFLVGSKLDFFQVFYKYNFLLSIFLLELCWDAKKQFFLMLGFHVAGFLNADRVHSINRCRSINREFQMT